MGVKDKLRTFIFIALVSSLRPCTIHASASSENESKDEYSLWKVDKFEPSPAIVIPLYPSSTRESISLDGSWKVQVDPNDEGIKKKWYADENCELKYTLQVPGNWNAQGLGGEGIPRLDEGVKFSELSMRSAKLKGSYVGLAWYRKSVEIPSEWQDRQIRLVFGGVLSSVRLWINGRFVNGRWTDGNSFYIDVTPHLKYGQNNTFVMAIDNRWQQTATVSHYQWYVSLGGPWHHMNLVALPKVYIEQAVVHPILSGFESSGIAEVHITLTNTSESDISGKLKASVVRCEDKTQKFANQIFVQLKAGQTQKIVMPVKVDRIHTWSWENPNLYKVTVELNGNGVRDSISDRFGMRTVTSAGNKFLLNGEPVFLRGQHLTFFWPNTVTPPLTKQEYLKHLKQMKDYGFNYLRTPWLVPEECYQAADELGMMLQLELPYAFEEFSKIKLPLMKRLIEECLVAYGNHPSFGVLCMSNEGSWDNMGSLNPQLCVFAKSIDPTRLIMDTDGVTHEKIPDIMLSEIVSLGNQTPTWSDYMSNIAKQSDIYYLRPCIDHEFLNVPSLYNPDVVKGYSGSPVLAPPQELIPKLQEHIQAQGMEKEYPLYVKASHHHQANFIKEGMERSRKNPLKAGFSMCAMHDIECGIHWGILDAFMHPKGISPQDMRIYNSPSVVLVDFVDSNSSQIQLVPDYSYSYAQPVVIQPYVSYFDHAPLLNATLSWQIKTQNGDTLAKGTIENISVGAYTVTNLPRININSIPGSYPQEVSLKVILSASNMELANSWPMWFFPTVSYEDIDRTVFASKNVAPVLQKLIKRVVTTSEPNNSVSICVTDESALAISWLRAGRNVLFLAKGGAVPNPFDPGWFKGDGNMGSLIRKDNLLGDFPHAGLASWQFRRLIDRRKDIPEGLIPGKAIISSVFGESWPHVQHQLFTTNTDTGGHLIYCQLRLLSERPEANYLLLQLLKNSQPNKSDPVTSIDQLSQVLKENN